jgi:hypothetical protein
VREASAGQVVASRVVIVIAAIPRFINITVLSRCRPVVIPSIIVLGIVTGVTFTATIAPLSSTLGEPEPGGVV